MRIHHKCHIGIKLHSTENVWQIPHGAGKQNFKIPLCFGEGPTKATKGNCFGGEGSWFKSAAPSMGSGWLLPSSLLGKPLPRGNSDWNVNRTQRCKSLQLFGNCLCVDHGRSLTMYYNYVPQCFIVRGDATVWLILCVVPMKAPLL